MYPWADLPAGLGERMRPHLPPIVEQVIAAVRAEVPEYDRPLEGEFGVLISTGVEQALNQFVDLLGRDEKVELGIYEVMGRAEYREGRTLDALQSAYRTGARVSWRAVAAFGEAHELDGPMMFRVAEAIFAYIDLLAGASVAGFAAEQSLREGSLQARRHALVELAVREPPATPDELERAAVRAGWRAPATVAVLITGGGDAVTLARRMPSDTIGAGLAEGGLLVVPDPDGPGRGTQIEAALRGHAAVLGPTVGWQALRTSARRARATHELLVAGRLGLGGDAPRLVRADDHRLALLLAADPDLGAELIARRLAPLGEMTPAARTRAVETLRAWLDAHGDVPATAAALHVHPQTVRYRLTGLSEAFGGVLEDPAARLELALALRAP